MTDGKKSKTDPKIKELQGMTDNLFERFDELDEKVDRLEEGMTRRMGSMEATMKADHEKVMTRLDSIVGMLQDRRDEEVAGTAWLQRHDRQIAGLDGRVQKLEEVAA